MYFTILIVDKITGDQSGKNTVKEWLKNVVNAEHGSDPVNMTP